MGSKQIVNENFSYSVLQKLPINLGKQSIDSTNCHVCYECSVQEASLGCQQCECSYCGECWIKVHSAGKSLMRHIAINIKSLSTKYCGKHIGKPLEVFCDHCASYLCAECLLIHQETHKIQLLKDKVS